MKTCTHCGTSVADGYRICPKCGGKGFGSFAPPPPVGGGINTPPATPSHRPRLRPFMQVAQLPRWVIVSILLGCVAFFSLMYAGTGRFAEMVAQATTQDEERQMLQEIMESADIRKMVDAALPEDHQYSALTRRIGTDLLAALPQQSDREYRFVVVNTREINAMAFPGGLIIVYTGLIDALDTPEELAAVLAHEIQHVEHRHGLRQHYKSLGAAALTGMLFGVMQDSGTLLSASLLSMKYTRAFETEADLEGARLMARAGVSPRAMVSMLEILDEIETGWTPEILRDHPKSGLRAKRVAALPEIQMDLPVSITQWND